jgi:hypothetical protein
VNGMFLAIDPGEMTGWALFNMEGTPIQMGSVLYGKDLYELLQTYDPDFFVVEEFMLRTKRAAGNSNMHYTKEWDRVYAARAIGYVEARAHELRVMVHYQQPSVMEATAKKFGLPTKGLRKAQHQIDAVIHGYYFAEQHLGKLPTHLPTIQDVTTVKKTSTKIVSINSYGEINKALKKAQRSSGGRGR